MRSGKFMNKILVTAAGALLLFGTATLAAAQQSEYNEYQDAVRNEQRQRLAYERNPSRSNYNEWMDAQRRVQREWAKYQQELRKEGGYRYNDQYNRNQAVVNTFPQRGMYRINMGGRYYNIDNRGYGILRDAVNRGYQQGYQAGLNDRRYSRNNGFNNNSIYRNGTLGYSSYVSRDQYQYYFQQGFQRGYEDGRNSQTRYGYRTGNSYNILGGVLNTILNIAEAVDDDPNNR